MAMRVIILTGSMQGTAAHHLPTLIASSVCEVAMVVLAEKASAKPKNRFRKTLTKILRIGPLGALNGVRMRSWYDPAANGRDIRSLEDTCKEHGIPFHITPAINSARTRELFASAHADLGVSLGNGYIGPSVFTIPKWGMINIHHEMLPDYQNAQSIIWQIHNMSSTTGYTIHRIDKDIDTGAIVHQEPVPIVFRDSLRETVAGTYLALLDASALGLVHVLQHFERLAGAARAQGPGTSYTTPSFMQFIRILRNHRTLRSKSVERTMRSTGR